MLRSAAMRIAEGTAQHVRIEPEDLTEILGPPRFEGEVAMRTSIPGVATGLAWTPVGGDILFIEAARIPGNGRLILTGQLGEVMKESAQAALSLVKGRASGLGLDPGMFEKSDIHIHVPAGAIPKDGPSAGVAMFTALVSLLTNRTVRSDTAMTGEISLRGLVLPVGGIKEKVVAAARACLSTVILPARNRKDYEDIPERRTQQPALCLGRTGRGRHRGGARSGRPRQPRHGRRSGGLRWRTPLTHQARSLSSGRASRGPVGAWSPLSRGAGEGLAATAPIFCRGITPVRTTHRLRPPIEG